MAGFKFLLPEGTRTTPSNNAPLVNTIATLETLKHAFLEEGHSIRLKCPQMHSNKLWKMIATMEDYNLTKKKI